MKNKPTIAFILCSERGPLENMSVLLAESIRRFGGELSASPIYSYAPRAGRDVTRRTKDHLARLEVCHQHVLLNSQFRDYPLANKPLVAAHAEETLQAEILVFVDTDVFFLAEPSALLISSNHDIALRPVDLKGVGVLDETDEEYTYWSKLYAICGVEAPMFVYSTVDEKHILGYWNSGLIAARREQQLFSRWADNFRRVMDARIQPRLGGYFVEQTTLAASVTAARARVYQFPNSYNYPIHLHNQMPASKRIEKFKELAIVHYHAIFGNSLKYSAQNPLADFFDSDEQSRWLVKQLDTTGVYPLSRWRRLALGYRNQRYA